MAQAVTMLVIVIFVQQIENCVAAQILGRAAAISGFLVIASVLVFGNCSEWSERSSPYRRFHDALFRSRYCRSSYAASSTSLCRHSAARWWQAIRPIRCTRRKSP